MASYNHPNAVTSSSVERSATFGKSFIRNLVNRLPYTRPDIIEDIAQDNPKFKHFFELSAKREELIQKQSVAIPRSIIQDKIPYGGFVINKAYHDFLYATMDMDKGKRLREYRIMAAYAELAEALDEICDECIVKDERDEVCNIVVGGDHASEIKDELKKEFAKYINHFVLEDNGWDYFRSILTDGELFFENIIHSKKPTAGILGVVSIPTELVTPIYDNQQNLVIKGYLLRQEIIDPETQKVLETKFIPLDKNQITYINSGLWNEDKSLRLPYIERARRAYKQLSLIEDSIVIYRLVRAPERLVFNVDVGQLPPPKAEAYVKRLMQQYWTKKSFDANQGRSVNTYDPQSMLDSYWFAKRAGSEGTNVTTLAGGQNLGQLDDLNYFLKKLYKSLKVPSSRLDPESRFTDGAEITQEELRFVKFIMRMQSQVAKGFKEGFITHLKLRDLWKTYDLKESEIKIRFNPPSHFHLLREQQIFELKSSNYSSMINNELVSEQYAQKKYLGWNDKEILENRGWLKRDAVLKWELEQMVTNGPNWKDAYKEGEGAEGPGGMGGPPMGGGDSAMPPDFGDGPDMDDDEAPDDFGAGPDDTDEAPASDEDDAPPTQQ